MHNIEVRDATGWLLGVVWGPLDWKESGKQWAATRYDKGLSAAEFKSDIASKADAKRWVMEGNDDAA